MAITSSMVKNSYKNTEKFWCKQRESIMPLVILDRETSTNGSKLIHSNRGYSSASCLCFILYRVALIYYGGVALEIELAGLEATYSGL